jgi:hypothetical protein
MLMLILAAVVVLLALLGLRTVIRHRRLTHREGDIAVRHHVRGMKNTWVRGHAIWVHDVFVFRASPAMWNESAMWVTEAAWRGAATEKEAKKLHKLGAAPAIVVLTTASGADVEFATTPQRAVDLLGPFAVESLDRQSAHP